MDELSRKARRLGGALEPIAAQVYFSPECHANYEALGFGPSPGDSAGSRPPSSARTSAAAARPWDRCRVRSSRWRSGCSIRRSWCLPSPPGGRRPTQPRSARRATTGRSNSSRASWATSRMVSFAPASCSSGPSPSAGRKARRSTPGSRRSPMPGDSVGDMWRQRRPVAGVPRRCACRGVDDGRIRRHRDLPAHRALLGAAAAHVLAHARVDRRAVRCRRGAPRATRSVEGRRVHGRRPRAGEAVEVATDRMCAPIVDALGSDFDELLSIMLPWGVGPGGEGLPGRRAARPRRARPLTTR